MLKISCADKVSNDHIFDKVREKRTPLQGIRKRIETDWAHLKQGAVLLTAMEGVVESRT